MFDLPVWNCSHLAVNYLCFTKHCHVLLASDASSLILFLLASADSSNLEIFLEMMNEKEIVLAVAHDDASKK